MAKKYIFAVLLFFLLIFQNKALPQAPPPPGCDFLAAVDYDNDGFAEFDIDWLINVYVPADALNFGYDVSGYLFEWTDNVTDEPVSGPAYMAYHDQDISATITYIGPGPNYTDDPWFLYYMTSCMSLDVFAYNGDENNNGIINIDEDTNGNGNLLDDDNDGDGIPNFGDLNSLLTADNTIAKLQLTPNPATDILNLNVSNVQIYDLTIYDLTGKQILDINNSAQPTINISTIQPGIYFVNVNQSGKSFRQKLIIN
ncbi:MAG TPA: T9SS type A sorting domain-containing protein [Flavobacterium sp.]